MRVLLRQLCVALALIWAGAATAQDVRSPILTIDSERLYNNSAFGRRIAQEIDAQSTALAEENRVIENELEAEEKALTKQRADLSPTEFRALADAFDARVQSIRQQREAEGREITNRLDSSRDTFLNAAAPVLEAIMREAGAAVVLERRSVFISANVIDITDLAIRRIDAVLGDGADD